MLSPEGKSQKTYDGGGETQKAEWIVTHAKVSEKRHIDKRDRGSDMPQYLKYATLKYHLNKNERQTM